MKKISAKRLPARCGFGKQFESQLGSRQFPSTREQLTQERAILRFSSSIWNINALNFVQAGIRLFKHSIKPISRGSQESRPWTGSREAGRGRDKWYCSPTDSPDLSITNEKCVDVDREITQHWVCIQTLPLLGISVFVSIDLRISWMQKSQDFFIITAFSAKMIRLEISSYKLSKNGGSSKNSQWQHWCVYLRQKRHTSHRIILWILCCYTYSAFVWLVHYTFGSMSCFRLLWFCTLSATYSRLFDRATSFVRSIEDLSRKEWWRLFSIWWINY